MRKAVRTFRIYVDRPVVKAGRLLTGRLCFSLRDTVSVKSVILVFEGHSKTSFGSSATVDGDGGGNPEYIFRVQVPMTPCLFEFEQDGKYKVAAGEHELPFGFPVPVSAPSTFAGKHGYVLYRCKAKLCTSIALGQSDFRAECPFRVIGTEDLNWHPYAVLPVSWSDEYKKRILCMSKADVNVLMRLPRTGFTTGESIPVSVEITNRHSRHVVKGSTVELVQRVEYECGGGRQRVTKQTISRLSKGAVPPSSTQIWEEELLLIPKDAVPSFLRGCERISVHYEVLFSLQPGIQFAAPIVIGTKAFDGATLKKIVQALPWKAGAKDPPQVPDPVFPPVFEHPLGPPLFGGLGTKTSAFNAPMPPYAAMPPMPPHIRMSMPPPQPMMYPTHQHFAHSGIPPPPFHPSRRQSEFTPTGAANWSFAGQQQHWQSPADANDKHVLKIEEIE